MSYNRTVVELGSLCEVVRGGSPRPIIDYITEEPDGVNWLKIGDVSETDKYFIHAKEKIKPSGIPKTREVKKGDLILSNSMSFGRAFITQIDGYIHDGWLRLRCDEEKLDKEFLYYFLISSYAQNQFKAIANGSVVNNLKSDTVRAVKIPWLPLQLQRKIALLLGSLDDKIELNNRIYENLEQQAFTFFQNWFALIEHSKIQIAPLSQITGAIIRGLTTRYIEKSELINLNQKVNKGSLLDKQYFKYLDPSIPIPQEKFAHKTDILLNSLGQGTLGRIHFYNEETNNVVIDQHITIIRALDGVTTPEFLYLTLASEESRQYFESCVTGTTGMQMLNISAVRKHEINVPEYELQRTLSETISPLFKMKTALIQQNEKLSQIRDTLLPRLMSGELDVSEIDL